MIATAMNAIEDTTCIRFEGVPDGNPDNRVYLRITNEPAGCYSFVGYLGNSYPGYPQNLNLQRIGCMVRGSDLFTSP